jgi:putative transposase
MVYVKSLVATYINSESEESWNECMQSLKDRGLNGLKYIVADNNKSLKMALSKHFQDILLQRCQVHFMRNFLAKISRSNQKEGIRLLHDVFASSTRSDAVERAKKLADFLTDNEQPKVAEWIDESIEETFSFYELPQEYRKQMRSTNMLERLNEELKRRSRCVRTFPNAESCMRLLGTLCMETSEEWSNRRYLKAI